MGIHRRFGFERGGQHQVLTRSRLARRLGRNAVARPRQNEDRTGSQYDSEQCSQRDVTLQRHDFELSVVGS